LLHLIEFALNTRSFRRATGQEQGVLKILSFLFKLDFGHSYRVWRHSIQQRWRAYVKPRATWFEILQIEIVAGNDFGLVGKLVTNLIQFLLGLSQFVDDEFEVLAESVDAGGTRAESPGSERSAWRSSLVKIFAAGAE
jgi:hypothetical protein